MRYERWVQHNLIREEGRLPALRELTQSAPVEKTAALSTELRGLAAKHSRATGRESERRRGRKLLISRRHRRSSELPLEHPQLMPQEQDLDLFLPLRA